MDEAAKNLERLKARQARNPIYLYNGVWYYTKDNLLASPRTIARYNGQLTWKDSRGNVRSTVDGGIVERTSTKRGPKGDPARVAARLRGDSSFIKHCHVHGETEHSVMHGRCLSCYNSTGTKRLAASRHGNPDRIAARRAGQTTYMATCPIHRVTEHSVLHGRCLQCYTTTGAIRQRAADWMHAQSPVSSARAEARRAGERTYIAHCKMHGDVAHDVVRGVCLGCYNTLGAPRPKSSNPLGYYIDRNGVIREAR